MKFTRLILLFCLLYCSCNKKNGQVHSSNFLIPEEGSTMSQGQNKIDVSELFSGYKFITAFSKKIKSETGLILRSYGTNHNLPKDYLFKNEVATITAHYVLKKTQKDTISLEQARNMIISLKDSLLISINSDPEVRPYLEIYPFTYDLLDISIRFEDENNIDLGTGVSKVCFARGKMKYIRYDIYEYTGVYPARGKHNIIHEETYPEAIAIAQKSGALTHY